MHRTTQSTVESISPPEDLGQCTVEKEVACECLNIFSPLFFNHSKTVSIKKAFHDFHQTIII